MTVSTISVDKIDLLERFINVKREFCDEFYTRPESSLVIDSFCYRVGKAFLLDDYSLNYDDFIVSWEKTLNEMFNNYRNIYYDNIRIINNDDELSRMEYFYYDLSNIVKHLSNVVNIVNSSSCEETIFINHVEDLVLSICEFFTTCSWNNSKSLYYYSQEIEESLKSLYFSLDFLSMSGNTINPIREEISSAQKIENNINWFHLNN